MTDKSSMVKKGCKGDASILQPTVMAAVPLILDRIYKAINDNVARKGRKFQEIFNVSLSLFVQCNIFLWFLINVSFFPQWAYQYKLKAFSNGESTPILDRLVFKNLKALVGGKVRMILTGGAPLSPETHNFIRTCFHVPLIQGKDGSHQG